MKKIVEDDTLRTFIDTQLLLGQSPEAISGRLKNKLEKRLSYISKESIYRYSKSVYGRRIEAQLQKKKRRRKVKKGIGTLDGRTFIDKRPKSNNKRMRIGDAEFDFIVSGKDGKGLLLVVVDRKLRVTFIEPIYDVNINNVHKAITKINQRFMKCLGFKTPTEMLSLCRKQKEQREIIKKRKHRRSN